MQFGNHSRLLGFQAHVLGRVGRQIKQAAARAVAVEIIVVDDFPEGAEGEAT